jgi:hypothetical protein
VRRGQRQVEQVKIKMGMQMDGEAFRATLLETQVRHVDLLTPMHSDTLVGHADQGPHEMELRYAPRPYRRTAVEPEEDGRGNKGFEIHQTFDLVLPSIRPQVFGSPSSKGMQRVRYGSLCNAVSMTSSM